MSVRALALVFAGGALGSLGRHLVGLALPGLASIWVVNIVGSLLLGLVLGLVAGTARDAALRPLLGTGFLGGFTTYGAFAVESLGLGAVAGPVFGLAAAAFQVVFGVVAALLGVALAARVRGGSALGVGGRTGTP